MAKILLVDDNLDILMILRLTFEDAGHAVVSTTDPLEALPLIDRERPDAAVLDIMMPAKSGWELLEEIRSQPDHEGLPVVVLTALSELDDKIRGLRGGADDYQIKPFEPAEILARVEGLMARRGLAGAAGALSGVTGSGTEEDSSAVHTASPRDEPLSGVLSRLEERLRARAPLSGLFLGRYEVRDLLGRGAMGTVVRGFDPKLRRFVALKTIRVDLASTPGERQVDRLLDEGVAGASFNHPHIVTIYDVVDEGDAAFLAMELVEGTTLEAHLAAAGKIALPRLIPLAAAVAGAVAAAHDEGILHRDIKPANVLLGQADSVKVSDFGISESLSRGAPSGRIFGTPGYLAPEILRGRSAQATSASDLFSLGVLLRECLTGRHPFAERHWRRTLYNTTMREVPPIRESVPEMPAEAAETIDRMLRKAPRERPSDAGAVARLFADLAGAQSLVWRLDQPAAPASTRPSSPALPAPPSRTPSRLLPVHELQLQGNFA